MDKLLAQGGLILPGTDASGHDKDFPIQYPTGFDTFSQRFSNIGSVLGFAIPLIFAIAGIGMLIMIIGAGMKLLTSAGDAKKMEQGQQQLTYAIVGFIIIFAAFWIVQILGIITGINFGSIFK